MHRIALTLAIPVALVCAAGERPRARTHVVAHRGLLLDAPENTLANFHACLSLGLGFELDVQRAKDGTLVCIHDDTVDRTTDGTGRVRDLTLGQLKSLDAGRWFGPSFRGQRVPTIDEVFALIARSRRTGVVIAVDLKAGDDRVEADIVKLAQRHKLLDRLLFIGRTIDDENVRKRLRAADKSCRTACLAQTADELDKAIADSSSDWAYLRFIPSPEQAARVHAAGKRIFIAGPTVAGNKPGNWRRAVTAGTDAVLTDYSIQLSRKIRSRFATD